jgi:hypothetical protein
MKEIYADDGTLLEEPSIPSITEVLQLSGLGYKLDVGHKDRTISAVLDSFRQTEKDISVYTCESWDDDSCFELARTLIEDIFFEFDFKDIVPRHGPGSVATGETGVEKWEFRRKYDAIHQCYPYYEYFVVNPDCLLDRLSWYKSLEPLKQGAAKVVLVPKDSRGPRIISMEPLEYQYIQQGLWLGMKNLFQSHGFTRRHVNFTDQTINQRLALQGSIDGSYATLDMKDASDRVSLALVTALFKNMPDLLRHLLACRTPRTTLPDTGELELHKFAPMGSALCFPIESIVHYVLAVASIMMHSDLSRWQAMKCVYVYGDDLIIRSEYAGIVIEAFPMYGLQFNMGKCFTSGPFRESCGVDAFNGQIVTPIRWRKPWSDRLTAVSLQAFCDAASQFYLRGYCRVANLIWDSIEDQLGKLPVVPVDMCPSYLARKSRFQRVYTPHKVRYNLNHQSYEHRAFQISFRRSERAMPGWSRCLKYLLTLSGAADEVSSFFTLKRKWTRILDEGVRG